MSNVFFLHTSPFPLRLQHVFLYPVKTALHIVVSFWSLRNYKDILLMTQKNTGLSFQQLITKKKIQQTLWKFTRQPYCRSGRYDVCLQLSYVTCLRHMLTTYDMHMLRRHKLFRQNQTYNLLTIFETTSWACKWERVMCLLWYNRKQDP